MTYDMTSLLLVSCSIMCMSGSLAAMSTITYPAISALVSKNAPADQQGVCACLCERERGGLG